MMVLEEIKENILMFYYLKNVSVIKLASHDI